ncbi:HIT family hydrolase [Bacteroidetes bacterium UKL13-3]|jgi:histidine triad (HIT) family protein|nr:HIT family hydrolase [Bacteroidetes bacterium UKL13-3]HCP94927.1 HIT family protein [Bacteroidota bacterium]
MPTIFSKIIAGEIPCYKVAETNDFMAFLDVRPLTAGHTLIIPKTETDYIFDIDDEHYAGLFLFAKIVAAAVKKAIPCTKVGMAVIGLEVPHAHIHLVPMNNIGDLNFEKERAVFTPEEYKEIADKIATAL